MHTQDSCLWRIDNGCSHKWTKSPSIRDGESSSLHIFNGDFAIFSLFSKSAQAKLKIMEFHVLTIPQDRH